MFATVINLAEQQRDMVSRAGAGDKENFRQLYNEYAPYAYGVLRRLMGDSPHIEDVLQQVFVKVFRELPEFKGDRPFRSWLGRACCLTVYNHHRKERRHEAVPFEDNEGAAVSTAAQGMGGSDRGPERAFIEAEIHRRTHLVLDKLTPAKRMAIMMCDFEGMSLKEAAEILGMQLIQLIEAGERNER
jgi:RNA polymerase sigma-70 factor (ECF subfamily)